MVNKGLGRGLESLIPKTPKVQVKIATKPGEVEEVLLSKIKPNPHQPRSVMEKAPLEELAASIREHGVIQPLVLMEVGDGSYEVLAGERRLRAAKMAGLKQVPVVIRSASKQQQLEVALVENVQRENLNPVEEAVAYRRLMDEFNLTQNQVAQKVGKSRSAVTNILRVLTLSAEIQRALLQSKLSLSHAKTLLGVKDEKQRYKLFKDILAGQMSVRDVEASIKKVKVDVSDKKSRQDATVVQYEEKLRQALGTKVEIRKNKNRGSIVIGFYSPRELQELVEKFSRA
ncbi:ParB/RepB/Spo0J family partition protein [Patescibacteria group bacterium]|nr:ParB/RepB/Spo0J family partition protein [Patescibacteria group bacterium]